MNEGSPVFCHLFSSPLTHYNNQSCSMTCVDELDYQTERRALRLMLEKSFNWVDIRWKTQHCNITNFLDAYTNCKIMHFTGHGERGVLAFEDNFGALQWVSHEEVLEMCSGLSEKPELVFLSACFGFTSSQAFLDLGIPHIVTVTADRVLDKASVEFTDAFYSGLFAGKTVATAFSLGAAQLVAQFPAEKEKFRLLGRGDHEVARLFGTRAAPIQRPHFDASLVLPPSQCYASAVFSLGRLLLTQEVYSLLQHGVKLINLTGARGVGKTEISLKVAEYARERYMYSRIIFIDFTRINEISERLCLEKLASSFSIPGGTGTVFSSVESLDVYGIVEAIKLSISFDEKILLILDGLDDWISAAKDFILALVTHVRNRLGDTVAVLLTSCCRVDIDASREIVVDGLSDTFAARLFALRAPRQLEEDELFLDAATRSQDPIRAFSRTKLLQSMKGNCKVMELVANELQHDGQPQNLLRYETYFREEIIPNLSHIVQMNAAQQYKQGSGSPGGGGCWTWTGVQHKLCAAYRRTVGIEVCRARPLSPKAFEFFASCPAWGAEVPAFNGYKIFPRSFETFFAWFEGALLALKKSNLWDRPNCIFGFISRQSAAELLAGSGVGTFIIGVSQSETSCLVINVVTVPGKVLPVKVKFNSASPTPFSLSMQHGMTTSFISLEDLIKSTPQLIKFFPYGSSFEKGSNSSAICKDTLLP